MDTKFRKACSQVLLLNSLLNCFQSRYDRAAKDNLRTYRYHLRLRLCTSEGVRNAFYEYATQMADRIETMESRLEQMGIQPVALYPEVDSDQSVELWNCHLNAMYKKALLRATTKYKKILTNCSNFECYQFTGYLSHITHNVLAVGLL